MNICVIGARQEGADMKKIILMLLLSVSILPWAACAAAARPEFSLGAGLFAGMYAVNAEILYRRPVLGQKNSCLRIRGAFTDSQNLSPGQDWRRYIPLCVDALFYFNDRVFAGCGLNYPIMVSDNESPTLGEEIFLGTDLSTAAGKFYLEAGYSALRRANKAPFAGLHILGGCRFDNVFN